MGRQWLHAKREVAGLKKGQVVGKLVKEIMVAAKLGGAESAGNARLAAVVEKARKASGLGLSICKLLVERHGGTIAIQNHPTGGCEVAFCLPLNAAHGSFADESGGQPFSSLRTE